MYSLNFNSHREPKYCTNDDVLNIHTHTPEKRRKQCAIVFALSGRKMRETKDMYIVYRYRDVLDFNCKEK